MIQVLNEFISALLQLLAFALIPFFFFLFRKDKSITFFKYIGLYKPTGKSVLYILIIALLFVATGIGLCYYYEGIKAIMFSPSSVTGKLRLLGFTGNSVLILLIIALLKTSLSEEILFRGFIAKRFINLMGFTWGNVVQSLIFGIIHLILFWALTKTTFIPLTIIFIFSTLAGWTIGYVKEKYASGSIIPGWIAHGLGNVISYSVVAFVF